MEKRKTVSSAILFALLLLATPFLATAQQPDMKQKFTQAQKSNAAAQRQYTWMSRTELLLKGESKNEKVESVHYNNAGQLEKTVVESTPQQDQGGGRLKKRVVEKKKGEFKELMEGLGKLAQSYAHLSSEQMQALAETASISQGQGEMKGTLRIQGTNVVVQGDTMTLWVDPATFLFRQVQIDSLYEKKPMKLAVEFQSLPEGPTVSTHVTLDYPEKQVRVLIDNSDYKPLQPPAAAAPAGQGQAPALDPAALDKLLAPIALYPDALLGQVLMCSMSPFEVGELGKWLQANPTLKGSAVQDGAKSAGFDPSFVALASFPQVVQMMAGQMDWTRQLGQAFAGDRKAIMASIQRLRAQAMAVGTLKDSPQQDVQTQTTESGQQVIVVQPANPQIIYVPQYNPQTVYVAPPPQTTTVVVQESSSGFSAAAAGAVGFTAGVILGAAANNSYWGPYGMYEEAWDDFYDHREDMYSQYSENRQEIASGRQESTQQRQQTRQEQSTQRQDSRQTESAGRQEGRQTEQASRQEGRQTEQASREEGRQTEQGSRQEGRQQQQGSRQESAGSRGHAEGGGQAAQDRSGTRSGAFSGYGSGGGERSASSRGRSSMSGSSGSRSGSRSSGGGKRR